MISFLRLFAMDVQSNEMVKIITRFNSPPSKKYKPKYWGKFLVEYFIFRTTKRMGHPIFQGVSKVVVPSNNNQSISASYQMTICKAIEGFGRTHGAMLLLLKCSCKFVSL